ncbi:hypothetical protein CK203_043209 [Vitis vinifera]|uniref:Retrovirus-related Pol polyprotein from transposon TNT 1-94 n=1 Tax=Vitis vinifera TaxID=29760 RepID=A0A438HP76_VITVI|nr:hypothetical protein CK203_043209 [Vitis vinifera]
MLNWSRLWPTGQPVEELADRLRSSGRGPVEEGQKPSLSPSSLLFPVEMIPLLVEVQSRIGRGPVERLCKSPLELESKCKKIGSLVEASTEKLELVHTDLWGPSLVASLGGSRYFITFIDDSSRKDGEDIPGTPQQNGVAERMNRTLNERARSRSEYTVAEVCRSSRNIRPPQRYSPVLNYLLLTDGVSQSVMMKPCKMRIQAIGKKALHNKWVYRIKNEHDGSKRYKARLVLKENLHLEQLDVKTTFLHGDLEEDLYMIQPKGSDIEKINNLKKAIVQTVCNEGFGSCKANPWFNMNEAKPVSTPLGSHFKLSKEQSPKTEEERDHMSKAWKAALGGSQVDLRYLKGSLDTCLCFTGASLKLQGYVDADFAGDIDSRKKAEYVAATEAGKEMIWLHGFLDELDKLVILEKICGSKNPIDMLTKGVTIEKLKLCATSIGFLA